MRKRVASIAVLVPVLARPANALPLVKSIEQHTSVDHRVVFLCTPGDKAQIAACRRAARSRPNVDVVVVPFDREPGDWARKHNYGRSITVEPLMLLGGDDLRFHDGWDAVVVAAHCRHPDVGVIGTNDLGNPLVTSGKHSTHPVVVRAYADEFGTIDDPSLMLHEGYAHAYPDNELVETAIARRSWLFCSTARVEHLHPSWRKAEVDDTYKLGAASLGADFRLYMKRRHLWRRPWSTRRVGQQARAAKARATRKARRQ